MHLLDGSWPIAIVAWFAYLVFAFGVVPIIFRVRFRRWPFVSPIPLTHYSAVECCYAAVYIAYSVALLLGPAPSAVSVIFGLAMLPPTILLQFWAVLAMRSSLRIGFDPERDRCPIVQRGPYRFVHHPIYWSLVLLAISQALLVGVDWRSGMLLGTTLVYVVVQAIAESRYWHRVA